MERSRGSGRVREVGEGEKERDEEGVMPIEPREAREKKTTSEGES